MENIGKNTPGDSTGSPSISDTRKEPRIKKSFKIKIKDENTIYPAVITSMSKTGMSLRTPHVIPTYKVIEILVKIKDRVISLNGSVRWVWEPSAKETDFKAKMENEIGVALHNPPYEYLEHFDSNKTN